MIILILGIVAAVAAAKAVQSSKESWGLAIGLVLVGWLLGAIAVFAADESGLFGGYYLNYSTWGLLVGSGVLFLIFHNR
ncbi:MAG: hypothetical protein IKD70_05525 [Eggerthellaceae bacterium]|nr:hypothetical protein [Eggerthellaceae bacterium]